MDQKSIFDNPKFKWWLATRFQTNFGKQMFSLIIYWQVYRITKNPLALGCLGLAEYLPFFFLALWSGHLADVRERRGLLMLAEVGQFVCAMTLAFCTFYLHAPLWIVYVMVGVASAFSSIEVAAAGSYVQTLIPKEIFPKAAAWNLTLFNSATILGPILGGWTIAHFSEAKAYLLTTVFFFGSVITTFALPRMIPTRHEKEKTSNVWQSMKGGLRFILTERMLLATMTLDLIAVLFGGAVALFPIFADMMHVGPTGLGMLQAAQAVGSFGVAALNTRRTWFETSWANLCSTVTVFGLCMIGFALSKVFLISLLILVIAGASDGVSVIIRSSILQARTPDHLRGRVVSVGSIFIRSSNELGSFESGLAAKLIGTVNSVVFGGIMTLLSVFGMKKVFSDLSNEKPA